MKNLVVTSLVGLVLVLVSSCFATEWCIKPEVSGVSVAETEKKTTDATVAKSEPGSESDTISKNVPKCSLESENLVTGSLVNGTADRPETLWPSWVNLTLAKRGQKWARDNIPQLSGSHVYGLISLLGFPDLNAVLLFTNQSDTQHLSAKRYSSTINQVSTWYNSSMDDPDSPLFTSLKRVRGLHTAAKNAGNDRMHGDNPRPLINKELYERIQLDEGMWKAFETDLNNSDIDEKFRKVPESYEGRDGKFFAVNQFQQALTQFAFVGFPVAFPERVFLIDAKDDDLHAFSHLWAVLGHALGIEEEYNIALQPDLKSAREYYNHIFQYWYLPQLFNMDFHTKVLLEAQLKGFEEIDPIFTPRTLLLRLLRDIVKIPVPTMIKELSLKDHRVMLQYGVTGLRGFADKLHTDSSFRDTVREKVKTKLEGFFKRP